MPSESQVRTIAFVGDYLPRKCGIATFTGDLWQSVATRYPKTECFVVPMDDTPGGYDYPPEVRFQIPEDDLDAYHRAADFLNFSNVDVVCLQHEYGIFGGSAGGHILAMLRNLRMPVVTTLHTVLKEPNADQRRVMDQLADLSARITVMSQRGHSFLAGDLQGSRGKDRPDSARNSRSAVRRRQLLQGPLRRRGKKRPVDLRPALAQQGNRIRPAGAAGGFSRSSRKPFISCWARRIQNCLQEQGETYRFSLERITQDLGIKKNVIFYNRFVALHELVEFIGAADIYVTPYLNPAQITSGTLAYSFGCGKAVVSTPYWHAEELLADGRGVLVPFGDSEAIAREVCALLHDEPRRHAMRKRAYLLGREMIWANVAHLYMDSFQRAPQGLRRRRPPAARDPHARRAALGASLAAAGASVADDRLDRTVSTRDLHDSQFPRRLLHRRQRAGLGLDGPAWKSWARIRPKSERASGTYAAFLDYAFDREKNRFHNLLSFDRRWLDEVGSDDCLGRSVWALGTCLGRSKQHGLQAWAINHFERALNAVLETTSPRCWAYAIIGIHEYSAPLERRSVGKSGAGHFDWPADRPVPRTRPTIGPGSRTSSLTRMPGCRMR